MIPPPKKTRYKSTTDENRVRFALRGGNLKQALKRKKGNNLATVELSEVLSQEQLRGVMMVDTENLLTLAVAMSKAQEKDWLQGYESIGGVSVNTAAAVVYVYQCDMV